MVVNFDFCIVIKRKRAKLQGEYKGIVKAVRKGAQKGGKKSGFSKVKRL